MIQYGRIKCCKIQNNVDLSSVDSKSVDSNSVDSKSVDSNSVDSKSGDSYSVDSKSVDSNSVDSNGLCLICFRSHLMEFANPIMVSNKLGNLCFFHNC